MLTLLIDNGLMAMISKNKWKSV